MSNAFATLTLEVETSGGGPSHGAAPKGRQDIGAFLRANIVKCPAEESCLGASVF